MAEYTLADIFGAGATQDISTLTIQKSSLPGLTADSADSAESLLVGLMLLWLTSLTEVNRLADETNRQITFSDAGVDIVSGQVDNFFRRSYALSLYKIFAIAALDPDDY